MKTFLIGLLLGTILLSCLFSQSENEAFSHTLTEPQKPWTEKPFYNEPDNFQFVIVSDRTGGHREGVFGQAVEKINQLYPEFVMSVGDLIEGYSKDTSIVNTQWNEFHGILDSLAFKFFYVAGNHDYSNKMMGDQWKERYGRDYYHFTYKNCLFLIVNTNDGDGVTLSEDQVAYLKKAIADNPEVRWTMVFMHHPIWIYKDLSGFHQIEDALEGRNYSVFAGHTHHYFHEVRKKQNYYVLATTGGGSRLRGPRFGEFDHVSWVTMTNEGPQLVNLTLSGIVDHDVSNATTREMARSLVQASDFTTLVMEKPGTQEKKIIMLVENEGDKPIHFKGRFYHNHQLKADSTQIRFIVDSGSHEQVVIKVSPLTNMSESDWEPLEMTWEIGYENEFMEPTFMLSGTEMITLQASSEGISLTERPIFLDTHSIAASNQFDGLSLKYTMDSTSPDQKASTWEADLEIDQTTTLSTALFDTEGYQSAIFSKEYRKVSPLPAQKIKKLKEGLYYQYYEGNFQVLPDFSSLTPLKEGSTMDFDPEKLTLRQDHFALQFEGYVEIPSSGIYNFFTRSDDGTKLYIDEQLVVDNDGSHSARTRSGMIALEKGFHAIRVDYFEDFLGEELSVGYETPAGNREELSFEQLYWKK